MTKRKWNKSIDSYVSSPRFLAVARAGGAAESRPGEWDRTLKA